MNIHKTTKQDVTLYNSTITIPTNIFMKGPNIVGGRIPSKGAGQRSVSIQCIMKFIDLDFWISIIICNGNLGKFKGVSGINGSHVTIKTTVDKINLHKYS